MATLAPGPQKTAPQPPSRDAVGLGALIRGLIRAGRPKQWLKNLLVVLAPAAAGLFDHVEPLLNTALAFGAFCLAASGTYLINDARDVEFDRAHPRKRRRPVASGLVPVWLAYVAGVLGLIAGVGVAALTGQPWLPVIVACYVVLTTTYSLWLKRIVILDMVGVAAGFVLRAVAGAAAVGVEASSWFLIVASLGSLFIVAGKRESELRNNGAGETRSTLSQYTPQFLGYVRATTSGALLVSYCLWALDAHSGPATLAFGLSIVPFAVGILRYAMLVESGRGEAPEDLVLEDRILLGAGLLVGLGLAAGVYVL